MTNKLVKIERHVWPALRDLFAPNSPTTFVPHNLVDNFIRWTDEQPDLPSLIFYSLNGDWSDGTFTVIYNDFLYIYTLATTSDRLQNLLELVDFSNGLKIQTIMSKDHPAILSAIKSKKLQIKFDFENLLHHLPAANAFKFDLWPPESITLKPITRNDVVVAEKTWRIRAEQIKYLQILRKFNPTIGAYNNDGQMVAWIFRHLSGLLGPLQVDKELYRRGLGTTVTMALSKKIAESGQDIGTIVDKDNTPSLCLFKKLGFCVVDRVHWTETLPIQ